MKNDYIPHTESELYNWETNFFNAIDDVATTLTLPSAQVTAVKGKITTHQTARNASIAARNAAQAAKETERSAKKEAVVSIRSISNLIKASAGYTDTIGDDLDIIGTDTEFDEENAKPHLKASNQGNNIVLEFNNPREVDGVKIFSRRGNETVGTFLAADTESPYVDTRPNLVAGVAEERKYTAWFFKDDAEIGLQSDEVSISITK